MLALLERYQVTLVHRTEESESVDMAYIKRPTLQIAHHFSLSLEWTLGKIRRDEFIFGIFCTVAQWERTWASDRPRFSS